METRYEIGPKIGVARVGNSPDSFYLEPVGIGALPIECSPWGEPLVVDNKLQHVSQFKDAAGRVRRQAARFSIFRLDDANPEGVELTLADPAVKAIQWTVHLANKKAAWYNFAELQGNLLYGADNSYALRNIPLRNAAVTETDARRALIIDPGPRVLSSARQHSELDAASAPPDYQTSFPAVPTYGDPITTLGKVRTDPVGRLVVLGGHGISGGDTSISSFAGADTWHDDLADGPIQCVLELADGTSVTLEAWCLVGSPKFAPELVNIVTLDDTMYDVAVRDLAAAPDMCTQGVFNPAYVVNFERDVLPILTRPGTYRWVANVPSMNSLSPPPFDARDGSDSAKPLRLAYLAMFREPSPQDHITPGSNTLFSPGGFPLMPLNSGSNSVSDASSLYDKFLTLTQTQYFFLSQWAEGRFTTEAPPVEDRATALTRASVGNCVGGPFCPGIEVTWSTRNPNIYQAAWSIRPRHQSSWYTAHGLDPNEDETASAQGCEPGDLTKRMAIPWQADFFQCSVQFVNFTNPSLNKDKLLGIPAPPTYYAYWWPPQSPWQVLTGDLTVQSQADAGTMAGFQVMFTRGINSFADMISSWTYMGFIANQVKSEYREVFPYFTEQERDHQAFISTATAVAGPGNVVSATDSNFSNMWYLDPNTSKSGAQAEGSRPLLKVGAEAGQARRLPARFAVRFASSRQNGRQPFQE